MSLYICPVCKGELIKEAHSFTCNMRHTFDIARKGYVNFLNKPVKSLYDKELFTSRRHVLQNSFFDGLAKGIVGILQEKSDCTSFSLLDIGCGEGTMLHQVTDTLNKNDRHIDAYGFDLSKEGIQLAAQYKSPHWCVADLAKMPFQNQSMDYILNILSPIHYKESQRCLKDSGLILKAIPGQNYLIEIKKLLDSNHTAKPHDNQKVKELFQAHFLLLDCISIQYIKKFNAEDFRRVIQMTPLSAKKETETMNLPAENPVTIDLELLIGRKL